MEVPEFFNTFCAFNILAEQCFCLQQFLFFGSSDLQVRFNNFDLCCVKTYPGKLFFDFLYDDLVQFIDGNGDINHISGTSTKVGECGEDLPVINLDTNGYA